MSGSTDDSVSSLPAAPQPRKARHRIASRLRLAVVLAAAMVVAVTLVANAWTGHHAPATSPDHRSAAITRPAAAPANYTLASVGLFDGRTFQGTLLSVEDCNADAAVTAPPDRHVGETRFERCVIRFDRLAKGFEAWLLKQLGGAVDGKNFTLVAFDTLGVPRSAIDVGGARLSEFQVGDVDAKSDGTVFLQATLFVQAITPIDPTGFTLGELKLHKLRGLDVKVTLDRAPVVVRGLDPIIYERPFPAPGDQGPWSAHDVRLYAMSSKAGALATWHTDSLLLGTPTEKTLLVDFVTPTTLLSVASVAAKVGIFGADSGMADPRSFDLYVEGPLKFALK